jgi:hypothetical protein
MRTYVVCMHACDKCLITPRWGMQVTCTWHLSHVRMTCKSRARWQYYIKKACKRVSTRENQGFLPAERSMASWWAAYSSTLGMLLDSCSAGCSCAYAYVCAYSVCMCIFSMHACIHYWSMEHVHSDVHVHVRSVLPSEFQSRSMFLGQNGKIPPRIFRVYLCMHIFSCVCVYAHILMRMCVCIYSHVYVCMHMFSCICVHAYVLMCMCVCICSPWMDVVLAHWRDHDDLLPQIVLVCVCIHIRMYSMYVCMYARTYRQLAFGTSQLM